MNVCLEMALSEDGRKDGPFVRLQCWYESQAHYGHTTRNMHITSSYIIHQHTKRTLAVQYELVLFIIFCNICIIQATRVASIELSINRPPGSRLPLSMHSTSQYAHSFTASISLVVSTSSGGTKYGVQKRTDDKKIRRHQCTTLESRKGLMVDCWHERSTITSAVVEYDNPHFVLQGGNQP